MPETALAKLDTAKRVLVEARDLTIVLKIRDTAKAYETFFKTARHTEEEEHLANEIRLRAQRRAGQLLRKDPELRNFRPIRGNKKSPLIKKGITKTESSRWQDVPLLL